MPANNSIFVDTSAFIAHADTHDQYHSQTSAVASELEKSKKHVTTTFVLMESCQFIHRRISYSASLQFLTGILSGDADVELIFPENVDLLRAQQIASQYADQAFSFVDCTSFAVIERLKISRAYSFDKDFLIFKFSNGPLQRIPS